MRAIDADALKKDLTRFYDNEVTAKQLIDEQPTIEPERKRGKWIPQDHNKHHGMISTTVYYFPRCSVCGESANYTNFCPNCGADMREEQDG